MLVSVSQSLIFLGSVPRKATTTILSLPAAKACVSSMGNDPSSSAWKYSHRSKPHSRVVSRIVASSS